MNGSQNENDMEKVTKTLKIIALIVGIIAGIVSILEFFGINYVSKTVKHFFAPAINLEQNLSPDALRELRKSSPDGTIRIEKSITIREEPNAEDQR